MNLESISSLIRTLFCLQSCLYTCHSWLKLLGAMTMAGKKKAPRKSAKKDIADQLIEAAFNRVSEYGWRRLTMFDLSKDTGFGLDEIHDVFPTKAKLLKGYVQRVDHRVFEHYEPNASDSTRDKIFDLMMRRFDEFNNNKSTIKAIGREACIDPETLCVSGCGLGCSMRKTLKTAGVRVSGVHGMMRVQALSVIFMATFRTWLQDNSEEMSKTMADLDKRLARAERFEQTFCRGVKRTAKKAAA
ncbi:MAG: hypothetical protein OQK24_06440 [Magnetovibrio sp.]|nr:hypothetical protein [Magnetovibrio sp.]